MGEREVCAAREDLMIDLGYLLLTIVLFVVFIAYVTACEALGREGTGEREP